MFRLRCFKRFKTTSFIALAALLICAVGAYTVHATTVSGYKSKVYYEFSLDNLEARHDWAYSDHHVYIINSRHENIDVDWEFAHQIKARKTGKKRKALPGGLPDDTVFGTVNIKGLHIPDANVRFNLSDGRQTYYGNLEADEDIEYYLEAYTRINIHGLKIPKDKIKKTLILPIE